MENRQDDAIAVLLAIDDYDALHVIPVPPVYLQQDRGYLHWLAGALPDTVANRSLREVAFRVSMWVSDDPKYAKHPGDDPRRSELLALHIAEKGRHEVWHARITRSADGLPHLREWERCGTDADERGGNLPYYIGAALEKRGATRGSTMPAANMVLGPWDVPRDFLPLPLSCEPIDIVKSNTVSTFIALFRPESRGPVIASQAAVYDYADGPTGFLEGALGT